MDASDPDWCSYLIDDVDEHAEWMRVREALTGELATVFYEGSLYGMAQYEKYGCPEDFDVWPLIQGGLDISREGAFYVTRDWFAHVRRYGKGVNASFLGECPGWHWKLTDRARIDLLGNLSYETSRIKEGEGMEWGGYRMMRRGGHALLVNPRTPSLLAVTR